MLVLKNSVRSRVQRRARYGAAKGLSASKAASTSNSTIKKFVSSRHKKYASGKAFLSAASKARKAGKPLKGSGKSPTDAYTRAVAREMGLSDAYTRAEAKAGYKKGLDSGLFKTGGKSKSAATRRKRNQMAVAKWPHKPGRSSRSRKLSKAGKKGRSALKSLGKLGTLPGRSSRKSSRRRDNKGRFVAAANPRKSTFTGGSMFSGLKILKNPLILSKNPGTSTFTGDSSFGALKLLKNPLVVMKNPLVALTNPGMSVDIPVVGWAQGLISEIPLVGPAVGAIGVSALSVVGGMYLVNQLMPMASEWYAKIPVAEVATFVTTKVPAVTTGALAASGLLLTDWLFEAVLGVDLDEYIGGDTLMFVSGGLIVAGAAMDIYGAWQAYKAGESAPSPVAEGTPEEMAGIVNWYGDAQYGDALKAPMDFSRAEGNALLRGPRAWGKAFGAPPQGSGMRQRHTSKHAGRAGHQWGWLLKTKGFDGAAKIAAMPKGLRTKTLNYERQMAAAKLTREVEKDVAAENYAGLMVVGNAGAI